MFLYERISNITNTHVTYAFKHTKPSLYPGAFVNFSQNANIKFSARSVGI